MELNLNPETAEKLNKLAQRTGRGADELIDEAVDQLIAYDEWFEQKVRDGLAAIQRGEVVPNEEVRAWIELRESSQLLK
jgi:predicted transcriptional regulator